MFKMKEVEDHIGEAIRQQEDYLKSMEPEFAESSVKDYEDLAVYNLETSGAFLLDDNDVDIITDGNNKFEMLIEDLKSARHFIHMQYYIIRDDVLFNRISKVLKQKAAEGVQVRVLYDAMGCRTVNRKFWKKLNEAGISTAVFFPAVLGRLQFRINYRNHRKIVVIDNRVAYVGGFNIGSEYIDMSEKFGHWRDTHLRICGSSVLSLQIRFVLDWNYAARENLFQDQKLFRGTNAGPRGDRSLMQIISSGPDTAAEQIRDNYLRLISKAKKSIYIQTPYFIPDESILNALLIAARSGIEVNIMIPNMPDHPFVYWATYSYIGDMVNAGAKCYIYENGFIHSKGIVVDSKVMCYGTANMDIRSFALNFEVNALVYDPKKAQEMVDIFNEDLKVSAGITKISYMERSLKIRVKEQICRLLSPLL